MRPEGPSNAALVILKMAIFYSLTGMWGIYPLSRFVSGVYKLPFLSAFTLVSGICAVAFIMGTAAAVRNGRLMSAEVRFSDKDRFVSQATEALVKRQYQPAFQEGNTLTFKPQLLWGLMYDAISLHIGDDNTVRVLGPRYCVEAVLNVAGTPA